jgi:hypothetical protein
VYGFALMMTLIAGLLILD